MKSWSILLLSFAVAGCGPYSPGDESIPWQLSCPHLAELQTRDPVADARRALARGDTHLLKTGGYVSETPYDPRYEVGDAQWKNQIMIPETQDANGCQSEEARWMTTGYARLYNDTILAKVAIRRAAPVPLAPERIGQHN